MEIINSHLQATSIPAWIFCLLLTLAGSDTISRCWHSVKILGQLKEAPGMMCKIHVHNIVSKKTIIAQTAAEMTNYR